MTIIEVKHLIKEYRLGQARGLKHTLLDLVTKLKGGKVEKPAILNATDDVSFSIAKGEVVGIIGTNGAGKSTLLKLLSGITTATSGVVMVNGTVAPLIEVGAGLNLELTGRENIFLNGAILGIPKKIIKEKLDDIIKFAELEQFIDTPIKRYSSGMKVRLGFSIATSLEADILIVDEVLAVGDLAFQRKCFDRMENMIKHGERTVLIVSHNIRQIERLCDRVILLDKGKIIADGDPRDVCSLFYKKSNDKVYKNALEQQKTNQRIQSSGEIELIHIDILDEDNKSVQEINSGDKLKVRILFDVKQALVKPEIVVGTHTTDFIYLTANSTARFDDRPDYSVGQHEIEYIVPSFPLTPGVYCIRFVIFDQFKRTVFVGETLKSFSVLPVTNEVHEVALRTLNLPAEWILNDRHYI